MKRKFFGLGLGSALFMILTFLVLILVRPVYSGLIESASSVEKSLRSKIEETTGLSVTYDSLSPSIFAAANFKKIQVADAATGKKLVSIKKVVLRYSLWKIFSGEIMQGFDSLSMNGVEIEFDAVQDTAFLNKIKALKKSGEDAEIKTENESEKPVLSLDEVRFRIPFNVDVRNLSVHYSDRNLDAVVSIKKMDLVNHKRSEGMEIKTSGKIKVLLNKALAAGKKVSGAVAFSVSGNIYPELDGSSALITLSGASGADFSVSRLNLLVSYSQNELELHTIRSIQPFSLYSKVNVAEKTMDVSSEFSLFDPFRILTVSKKSALLTKLSGTQLSGFFRLNASEKDFSFRTNIGAAVSKKLFGEDLSLHLVAAGNKRNVTISQLSATGPFVNAEFSGELDLVHFKPSGILELNFLRLKNEGIVSTEVYIDPVENGGFMCFAPQVFLNDQTLTALQFAAYPGKNSTDFSFDFYDYSHADYESAGHVKIDGSFIQGKEKFLQASLSISGVFLDSVMMKAAFLAPLEKQKILHDAAESMAPYVFDTEAYISSDFKGYSINAPACLLANTQKDRELLIFAVDGSNETFNISQFDLQYGNMEAHASAAVDFINGFKEYSFVTDFNVNSIPYHFSGSVNSEWISVSGDYDFDAMISAGEVISGMVSCRNFPIPAGKEIFSVSSDVNFNWNKEEGIAAEVRTFELEQPSSSLDINPHLAFSGTANRYGFEFNTFVYSDIVSSVDGSGSIVWNLNDGIFDSIHIALEGANVITSEKLSVTADFSNPSQLPFSLNAVKNDFYMSVAVNVEDFPSSRLLKSQNSDNVISLDLTATGTISNPFVSMNVHEASVLLYGYPLNASGSVVYDDTGLNVKKFNFSWSKFLMKDFDAIYDFEKNNGIGKVDLEIAMPDNEIKVPLNIAIRGESAKKNGKSVSLMEKVTIDVYSEKVTGNLFAKPFPFRLTAVKTPSKLELFAPEKDMFRASFEENGKVMAHVNIPEVKFDLNGTVIAHNLNLEVKGLSANLKRVSETLKIPFLHFNSGYFSGALKISGYTTDPEFTGAFSAEYVNLLIPMLSKHSFSAEKILMTVSQGEARINETLVFLGKGFGKLKLTMDLHRWRVDSVNLRVDVDSKNKVPLEMSFPFIFVKGEGSCGLDVVYSDPNELNVSGWIVADNTDVEIVTSVLQSQFSIDNISRALPKKKRPVLDVVTDLDIKIGQKVQVLFNPLLRGLVAPGTGISLYIDSFSGDFDIKSDIVLRGGEIVWLNRNFYMKNGRITLNESKDKVDPRITVRAETRERDENGNLVTIILSANNEPLSTFKPLFSSSPAKSEQEIMLLLGEVVSADSDDVAALAAAGGDYIMQATVIRRIENTLREMLNFDIFSIRTNVLQNSVKLTREHNVENKQISVGNFIDNSTVYIGKYFGSSMYVDTLLHWTYDETKDDDGNNVNAIVFQPEFGFEMASPFVNIRLGVAPDIEAIKNGYNDMWVPSTSITLSWKHSF